MAILFATGFGAIYKAGYYISRKKIPMVLMFAGFGAKAGSVAFLMLDRCIDIFTPEQFAFYSGPEFSITTLVIAGIGFLLSYKEINSI